ncbi:BatA domain-containing protein [Salmonirosea aquatica]|uniref:Aerotolerance regulator N-terminal domain-containing protein n=1 Tax=Salmonirosea aquatica TaxID=2654236 RepID=A0A7C9FCU1_9BACT|nr:hypothetical protein [Cytophagaceae bacterium SJW1-29]
MQFLQPLFLWGILAVAIPIALHFWHRKKGTVIAWAATRFLFEKSQQPQRGFRLDQILLLILRCVLLILVALLLSEPVLKMLGKQGYLQTIHLVQPDAFVVDNYRFELEEARQNGEPIYWLTPTPQPANELAPPADPTPWNAVMLQNAINRVAPAGEVLHLYMKNERKPGQLPFIQTPTDFHLHTTPDTLGNPIRAYRLVANQQKLYVDTDNILRASDADASVRFASQPVGEGPVNVSIDLKDPLERKTALAALQAFAEVYRLEINWIEKGTQAAPDIVVTDQLPLALQPATLYLVTNQAGLSAYPNVFHLPEKLTPQTSPLVARGQLPEWLGQRILAHWGIGGNTVPMSRAELGTLFKPVQASGAPSAQTQRLIFAALLVVCIFERILSLLRNA